MTEEEIRKLVTQYADELFKDDDMSDSKNIDEYHDVWVVCNSFGNFRLEKFCIVEKEKVRGFYKAFQSDTSVDERTKSFSEGNMNAIEEIFGEELFNDTEK